MHIIKNGDEITVLVNDEAAENILTILGFDNEEMWESSGPTAMSS